MCDEAAIVIGPIENNAILAGITTGVNLESSQDGILIVGADDGELEALAVVEDVG